MCKSALHHHNSKWLPYKYDINVYRGCGHRCIYCYALYSHDYIGGGSFYYDIFAKTNISDLLQRELPSFSRQPVNLGGVCDSYQPAERECTLMPKVLELLAKYSVPTVVCTKSKLILRDIDLLKKVDEAGGLGTAVTVTTMDETVAKLIEPGASTPSQRMEVAKELKQNGIGCGVHLMPIIPFLTSDMKSLEAVYSAAKSAGADYVLAGGLNLKGRTRQGFFNSVRERFPSQYRNIREIYQNKPKYYEYKQQLFENLGKLRKKYDMPQHRFFAEQNEAEQLSFL